jgi:hypothetical protein
LNDALTIWSLSRFTSQVVPEELVHPDAQPRKLFPAFGVAVKVTVESVGNEAEHVDPQLIPPGELIITPSAAPLVTSTARLDVTVPVGQPSLAGPSTVTVMVPTTTFPFVFPASVYKLAEILATPHATPSVNCPELLTSATMVLSEAQVTWPVMFLVSGG